MILSYPIVLSIILAAIFSIGQCCEPIQASLCRTGISYNTTTFPNLAGHSFQEGATIALQQYTPLIELNCSPYIREFLCRVFIPECGPNGDIVAPTWEMCLDAFNGCGTLMSKFGFSWPSALSCLKYEQSTLGNLKTMANDHSIFWFGSEFKSICSVSRPPLLCQWNFHPKKKDSIFSRLNIEVNVSTIDRLMGIQYNYEAGYVFSCNNNYSLPGGNFEVNPLSTDVYHPWEVRHMPTIKWTFEASDLFTLLLYDVGFNQLHALFINIQGNDINNSIIIKNYTGPLNPTSFVNPYVFLLYKQIRRITLHNGTKQGLLNDPLQFIQYNTDIGDLKSISWVKVQEDPYSIKIFKERYLANNCPILISQVMKSQDRPFLPRDQNLNMSLDITYTPSAITFTSCCKTYKYGETSFKLNPIANITVKTANVRSSAIPTVNILKQDIYPNASNFSGDELYSLIMVDPDAATTGNDTHPRIHWMVLNIAHGDVIDGVTVKEYRGPQPPSGIHTYYFLLYLQKSRIEPTDVRKYTSSCSRCFFDINGFTNDESLVLTGASWFTAEYDEYIRHLKVDENEKNEDQECKGQPAFTPMCTTDTLPSENFG